MKLADMLDLGSNAKACRFKSCHPHQSIQTRTFPTGETFGFIVFLNEIAQFKKNDGVRILTCTSVVFLICFSVCSIFSNIPGSLFSGKMFFYCASNLGSI